MPKRKVETPEEQRKRMYNMVFENSRFLPEPTYFFKIGDPVEVGSLKDAIVSNVFWENKIYEIDYTNVDTNYGKPIETPHSKNFFDWLSVRPPNKEAHNIINNKDIFINYSQRHIGGLFSMVYHFGIDFNPVYQRDYVWELKDKISLISSIFDNVGIGQFVFSHYSPPAKLLYKIIDGKQRIDTICQYYENRFEWHGLYFNDLSNRERDHFDNYPISYGEIKFASEEQEIRAFLMLNKSGKVMSKKHLKYVEELLKNKEK